jgi:hypothetical protein
MVNLSSVLVARSPTLDDRGQLTRYPTVHRSADYGYLLPSGVPCPTGRDDACRLAPSRDRRDGGRRGRRLGAARSNSARPPRRSYCPGVTPHWAASSSTQVVVAAAGWAGGVATTTNSVTPAPASSGSTPGLPSASATATLSSCRLRPRRSHCSASAATRSATALTGRLKAVPAIPEGRHAHK